MAKRHSEKEVASVRLFELAISEDELEVLMAGLTTLLTRLNDDEIEATSGASRNEVEAILQDLQTFLKHPFQPSVSG